MTELSRIARRITWVLFANQSLASAGFIASATINSIIGAKLGGSASYAGVPSAVYQVGAAFAASAWGYVMDRIGRRNGMVAGLLIGVIGNALVLVAIGISSFSLFLTGMVLMGITNAAVVLGTFAAGRGQPAGEARRGDLQCCAGWYVRRDRGAAVGGTGGKFWPERWEWMNGPVPISLHLFCLRSQLVSSLLGSVRTRVIWGNKLPLRTLILQ